MQHKKIPEVRFMPVMQYLNALNRVHLQRTTLAVARYMASHADYDTGKNIFPGEKLAAFECGFKTARSMREHLKILREYKLLTRVRHNSGRMGWYDEYWLTWPLDEASLPLKIGPHVDPDKPLELVRLHRNRENEKPRRYV